jgi:hypothetical protein
LASIQVAVIAVTILIGLAAVALAPALLLRADRDWRSALRSRRGLGLLSLFAAGCLLAVGGQFLLSRFLLGRLAGPTALSDGRTRFQMALMEPVEALVLRVHGPDPFRDRSAACSLRLIAVTRAGKKLVSEVPRSKMSLPWGVGAKVPRLPAGDVHEYVFDWRSVIEGSAGEEARELASRVAQVNDWRRFDHVDVEVVGRASGRAPIPESLLLTNLSDLPVELFHGYHEPQKDALERDARSYAYLEPGSKPIADRLGWIAEETYSDPRRGLNPIAMGLVAAGVALLAVGAGLLIPRRDPDREGGRRLRPSRPKAAEGPPVPAVEPRAAEADSPVGAEPCGVPSRAPARAASAFVWAVWALMILASLTFVVRYSHNIPFMEDWLYFVPYVTGEERVTPAFLWAQDCEHRYPLSKAVGLAVFKLSGPDFRAPTIFRTVILGVLALAMILVARGLRGRARFSDAFLPLALLQMGFPNPLIRGWGHVAYLVPMIVASPMLVIAARRGTRLSPGTAMLAGLCLAMLPLCSAAGLLYLPILSLWLGCSAVLSWRAKDPRGKRTSLVLLGWIVAAYAIVLLYFRGYDRAQASQYSPLSPSIRETIETILAVMTAGFGEAAERVWPTSGLAMLALTLLSAGALVLAAWRDRRGPDRPRALGLLFFLGASGMFVLGLGWGRAGLGNTHVFAYYSLLSAPFLCVVYLAWCLDRRGRVGRLAQMGLFALILISLAVNIPTRLHGAREEHAQSEAFERDLRRGMPPYMLLARNWTRAGVCVIDETGGSEGLRMMHRAGVGAFRHMQDDPDFRAVPLPMEPIESRGIEWQEGMGRGANGESYLTYALPEPMYVAAIRLQSGTPQPGAAFFSIAWRRKGDRDFPERRYVSSVWPTKPLTFAVAETIDQIRIYPNRHPSGYHPFYFSLSKFEALVPEGEADNGQSAVGRPHGAARPAPLAMFRDGKEERHTTRAGRSPNASTRSLTMRGTPSGGPGGPEAGARGHPR